MIGDSQTPSMGLRKARHGKVKLAPTRLSQPWQVTPEIQALRRCRQEDCQGFKASLAYLVSFRSAWVIEQDKQTNSSKGFIMLGDQDPK